MVAVPTGLGRGNECTAVPLPRRDEVSDHDAELAQPLGLAAVVGIALDARPYSGQGLATRLNIVEDARAGRFNEEATKQAVFLPIVRE